MKQQVRFAGYGGQGVILAAVILAEAAGLHENKEVAQTQSYGPEARGGAARADVVVSDSAITYPRITEPDIVVLLSPPAASKYLPKDCSNKMVFHDSTMVNLNEANVDNLFSIPATQLAENEVGNKICTNIVMLGAVAGASGIVSIESLRKALVKHVPAKYKDLNLKALDLGFATGEKMR
ncbi:MAG TPA: 2-oxoacid:ferredoxin oxidoreductase subunit gamma [Thermoanaerobacterales bacterium]|nr:2-oxoacid:ferredoxin oxidoreductase subunit gamma [Thermoanaerobacterales bacterium]